LDAFTSTTETFDLRDQLKKLVWNPEKDAIKQHILTMTNILYSMALLGDHLTDRDKVEYFMSSLINKSYLVKKINLSTSFDQACRDVIEFVSKEKLLQLSCNMIRKIVITCRKKRITHVISNMIHVTTQASFTPPGKTQ
jgi:hypothetical protein